MNWKKTIILMLCLVFMSSLVACNSGQSSNNSNSSDDSNQDDQEKVVLQYWTGDRHDQEYIQKVIDQYNETNTDNIEVQMTVMSENYDQALDIAFSSNQAPDVFRAKNMKELVAKDFVKPIEDLLTDDMKAKFDFAFRENKSVFDGHVYSLANYGSTMRLIYNQDLFDLAGIDGPPETMAEMVETAKKITEVGKKDGIYGFALNFKSPGSAFDRSIRQILQLSGYHGFGYDPNTVSYDFTKYGEVMSYFHQMHEDGSIIPGAETLDIDPMRAQFALGKIGMYMSYSVEPGVYASQFPTEVNWAAALPPTLDGERKGAVEMDTDGNWLAISKKSENQDEAWKFMQYMYSDEVLKGYHENGMGISVVPHIVASAETPNIKGIEGFLPTEYDAVWPAFPWVAPEGPGYPDAFLKYMIEGGDLNKIVEDLNTRYIPALQKEIDKGNPTAVADPDFNVADLQGK